jgi:type II secretory pathway component GspD/PulD (secretin)
LKHKISLLVIINLLVSCYIIPCFLSDSPCVFSLAYAQSTEDAGTDIGEEKRRIIEESLKKRREAISVPKIQGAESAGGSVGTLEMQQPVKTSPSTEEVEPLPQETKQPRAVEVISSEPEKQPVASEKTSKLSAVPTVSFFFDDADIFEVVQTIFADVLKVNYIIDPQVKGRVNFRTVTPIPKDEVLAVMEIIFRLNGIGFVEESGLYRIIPLSEVSKELVYSQIGKTPEKVAIEMFAFKNLELKEAMPDIENALGLQLQGGTVRILPIFRLNSLVVVASSQQQLDYIRQWIVVFDKMFAVAKPKIFVYPLQNSKADHIASLLQSIFSGTAAAPSHSQSSTSPAPAKTTATAAPAQPQSAAPKTGASTAVVGGGGFVSPETKAFADEITNSLIILATPSDYSFIEETLKKIDTMPRQVVIEGLIAQVTLTDNLSFGFSWSLQTDLNIKNLSASLTGIPTGATLDNTPGNGFTFIGTDPTGNVRAKLTAALTSSKGKVLAAPHILVLDNREARIQVGSQIPIATSTTSYVTTSTTENSNPITSTIQYKDIGIILKVKPQINDSGLVSIELTQEVSSVGKTATIAGQGFSSIDKTETTTNLIAQDGETIIIGGLIREDATKEKNGIPLLSQIPLIGNLFSYTSKGTDRTELVILLTPHVIRSEKQAGDVTTDYVNRYKGSSKDTGINKFMKEQSSSNADKKDTK